MSSESLTLKGRRAYSIIPIVTRETEPKWSEAESFSSFATGHSLPVTPKSTWSLVWTAKSIPLGLATLPLLRYHHISKKTFPVTWKKLCQKPFDFKQRERFEDQDQDLIEKKSPQHSMKVGLSIQVVRPIIQHPRPGRWLLPIQVPLILTKKGLIDFQPS